MEKRLSNILLVENDYRGALIRKRFLEMNGLNVVTAYDGQSAIALMQKKAGEIDLILMDIELGPDMDGVHAASEILKLYDVPVIFLSSHAESMIVDKTKSVNSFGYISKESGNSVVLASMNMAFKLHRALLRLKENEKLFLAEQEFNRTLLQNMGEGIALVNLNEEFIFTNRAGEEIFETAPGGLVGRSLRDFTDDSEFQKYREQTEIRKTGVKSEYDTVIQFPDGHKKILLVTATPQMDDNSRCMGTFAVFRDITERRNAEKKLNEYRARLEELVQQRTNELKMANDLLAKELEKKNEVQDKINRALKREKELNQLKTRIISTASHEFRTPLTTMFSSAELLGLYGRDWDEGRYADQITRIKRNIRGLTSLLDEVLMVNRAESGKTEYSPVWINIEDLFGYIYEDTLLMLNHDQSFSVSIELSNKIIFTDEKLLKTVLMNLVSNAVKYSPIYGEIKMSLSESNGSAVIKISDNGIGIPKKDVKHIFDAFYRAGNTGHIHGTGLGLAICKRYAELLNGEIECRSAVNKGTVFTLTIPLIINK